MHPKVLSPESWALLRGLRAQGWLQVWGLAGGTGLALQLGHRFSEDLDFFHHEAFDSDSLVDSLSKLGSLIIQSRSPGALHVVLAGTRFSFLQAQAPLLFEGTSYRGLTLADPRDIAVMKLVAIGGRGSRKDFVDLYFYLRSGGSLEGSFSLLRRRFAEIDYNEYQLLKSLVYFADADAEPMPRMIRDATWETVKEAIVAEVLRLSR
jgi:hypothetical protein